MLEREADGGHEDLDGAYFGVDEALRVQPAPTQPGVGTCARCGHNICEGCRIPAAGKTFCGPCAMRAAGVTYRSR